MAAMIAATISISTAPLRGLDLISAALLQYRGGFHWST
jgi:hypothetical protein